VFVSLLWLCSKGADIGMKAVKFLPKRKKGPQQWITLNVGGTRFLTTRSTLLSEPDTLFHYLIRDDSKKAVVKNGKTQTVDVASLVCVCIHVCVWVYGWVLFYKQVCVCVCVCVCVAVFSVWWYSA
jgi:BTB/POZ domain